MLERIFYVFHRNYALFLIVMVAEGNYTLAVSFILGSMLIAAFLAYYYRKQKRKRETAEALGDLASGVDDAVCCLLTFFDF